MDQTLRAAACHILALAEPAAKVTATRRLAAAWRGGAVAEIGHCLPPDRPARPARPALMAPREMARRGTAGAAGRIALFHALAHIELNAIDLAWDIIARFDSHDLPRAFFDDWVKVADDEAIHFDMLAERLAVLGAAYGDLPAHDGLWQSAEATAQDLLARLAVVPMVLEARGLDVTPATIAKLTSQGDPDSAAALQRIFEDEITHVASGHRWFAWLCAQQGLPPAETFHDKVRTYFRGKVKAPFNHAARARAGLAAAFYMPLSGAPSPTDGLRDAQISNRPPEQRGRHPRESGDPCGIDAEPGVDNAGFPLSRE